MAFTVQTRSPRGVSIQSHKEDLGDQLPGEKETQARGVPWRIHTSTRRKVEWPKRYPMPVLRRGWQFQADGDPWEWRRARV